MVPAARAVRVPLAEALRIWVTYPIVKVHGRKRCITEKTTLTIEKRIFTRFIEFPAETFRADFGGIHGVHRILNTANKVGTTLEVRLALHSLDLGLPQSLVVIQALESMGEILLLRAVLAGGTVTVLHTMVLRIAGACSECYTRGCLKEALRAPAIQIVSATSISALDGLTLPVSLPKIALATAQSSFRARNAAKTNAVTVSADEPFLTPLQFTTILKLRFAALFALRFFSLFTLILMANQVRAFANRTASPAIAHLLSAAGIKRIVAFIVSHTKII